MAFTRSILRNAQPEIDVRQRVTFSVDDYHQLLATGILDKDDRIELINRELTIMPPIGPEHSSYTRSIATRLPRVLPENLMLQISDPITIAPNSEPQPDAAVVRARKDNYKKAHPGPADVLLVIEVADSSAPFDNEVKAKLYGKAGIPEYWAIEIKAECLRIFTAPSAKGYRKISENYRGDVIQCGTIPQLKLKVDDLLI